MSLQVFRQPLRLSSRISSRVHGRSLRALVEGPRFLFTGKLRRDCNSSLRDYRYISGVVCTLSLCAGSIAYVVISDRDSDPGRLSLAHEALGPGEVLLRAPLQAGGVLQVTSHRASQVEGLPQGIPEGSTQEWRVLRFAPREGGSALIQSMAKVCIPPPCSPDLLVRQRGDCLLMPYTKSLVTVALTALHLLGAEVRPADLESASPLDSSRSKTSEPSKLRVLCIGLGGGTVPTFLSHMLPHCEIDVAELEPAVVQAAMGAMGFVTSSCLRVVVEDGVSFALRKVSGLSLDKSKDGILAYDAVLIDAYDAEGNVPRELWAADGGLARALASGLLKSSGGVIATNFLPDADLALPMSSYRRSLSSNNVDRFAFSVRAEGSGNLIAVYMFGNASCPQTELKHGLEGSAAQVQAAIGCPFDMASLATRGLRQW